MKGNHEESLFYGFAEGDKMIVVLEETQNKAIKEFEIIESPTTSKFMDINTSKVTKELQIQRNAVYQFRIKTAFIAPRTCRMTILRIPKDETTLTVTGNRSLVAHFQSQQQQYTVNVSANPSTGGSVTGGGTYNHGATCTVHATANIGFTFTN